jgi:hypothetical protein
MPGSLMLVKNGKFNSLSVVGLARNARSFGEDRCLTNMKSYPGAPGGVGGAARRAHARAATQRAVGRHVGLRIGQAAVSTKVLDHGQTM